MKKRPPDIPSQDPTFNSPPDALAALARRHLTFGWWLVLIFLTLGLGLETLHGFKVLFYLDLTNETRRLLWTLAHAHGTLFGLINLAFAFTLSHARNVALTPARIASRFLIAGSLLMPLGFLSGGAIIEAG